MDIIVATLHADYKVAGPFPKSVLDIGKLVVSFDYMLVSKQD
jgi:hypothetical protein